jgi:ribosomal protein L24E
MMIEDTIHIPGWGVECIVCGKDVTGGRGFAHIEHNGEMVALCGPLCMELFRLKPDYYIFRRDAAEWLHHKQEIGLN